VGPEHEKNWVRWTPGKSIKKKKNESETKRNVTDFKRGERQKIRGEKKAKKQRALVTDVQGRTRKGISISWRGGGEIRPFGASGAKGKEKEAICLSGVILWGGEVGNTGSKHKGCGNVSGKGGSNVVVGGDWGDRQTGCGRVTDK